MGDMGDEFRAMREASQEKRANNREASTQMLRDAGISFVERNMGAHLMVDGRVDFWPGTGLWIVRDLNVKSRKRRGVKNLIRFVKETTPAAKREPV